MKALVFERYGKAEEVLSVQDLPEPAPGPGEVKVKMLYSPINPSDVNNTAEGTYRDTLADAIWNFDKPESEYTMDPAGLRPLNPLPGVPGIEGVGVVVEAGSGMLPRLLRGKRVAVIGGKRGNWQEYNVVDARQALPVKGGVDDEQAACSFVNPVTAWAMVRRQLQCGAGDVLLQSAGNSECGKMVARLGKRFGYRTISIVRNGDQAERLLAEGADHVIDSSTENLRARVYELTQGQGVRHALDPIAGSLATKMIGCLGLNGTLIVYGTLSGERLHFSARDLMTPLGSVRGFFLATWMLQQGLLAKLSITRQVSALVKSGELRSDIRQSYPLDAWQDAIADVRQPGNRGKVLFKLGA